MKGKWPCTINLLYNENTLIGRLKIYFSSYFESYTTLTAETLLLFVLSMLVLESAKSIRFLYRHFLKSTMTTLVDEYENLDLIGNLRVDTAIYDLPPAPFGKRGRPTKRGRRLSIMDDFTLSEQKIGGCYIGVHTVLTNIFGGRKVLAYVTSAEKGSGSRRFYIRSEGI